MSFIVIGSNLQYIIYNLTDKFSKDVANSIPLKYIKCIKYVYTDCIH